MWGYSLGTRRGGFLLPSTSCKFMVHCEFTFFCTSLGKVESWVSGKWKFCWPQASRDAFHSMSKGRSVGLQDRHICEEVPRAISEISACLENVFFNRVERHKKSPRISLAPCLWNTPHFEWISPSSTDCMLFPPRRDHYPLLLQSHGQNTEENVLQSFVNDWFLRFTAFCFLVAGSLCLEVVIICPR